MNTIRVLSLTLALVCTPFVISCSDDKEHNRDHQEQSDVAVIEDLVRTVQTVEENLSRGFLLKNATANDKAELKQNLYDIKVSVYRLREDAYNQAALSQLYLSFNTYTTLNLQEDDRARLEDLDQKLREALDIIAGMQGRSLDGIERKLFTKVFNLEIAPFQATTPWVIGGNHDKQYVQAGGKNDAWLISPTLDLTNVKNPSFVVSQAINERGADFLKGCTYLVSTNYVAGDPAGATWESVTVQSMPDGTSYNFRESEHVSLKAYEGKKIVFAFKIESTALVKMSSSSSAVWEIGSFSVFGNGSIATTALNLTSGMDKEVEGPKQGIKMPYVKDFMRNSMTNFWGNGWSVFTFTGNKPCCIKASGKDSTAWLVSPRYDFAQVQNPGLQIRHAINKQPKPGALGIFITTDADVSDPAKVQWKAIEGKNAFAFDADQFVFTNSEQFDLSAYAGQKVVIAFKYSHGSETPVVTWELQQMVLSGEGVLSYESTKPVPPTDPTQPTNPTTPTVGLEKDFSQGFGTDFTSFGTKSWLEFKNTGEQTPCCAAVTSGPTADSYLVSRDIDLTGLTNPTLKFDHSFQRDGGAEGDIYAVKIRLAKDATAVGANWTDLFSYVAPAGGAKTKAKETVTQSLSAYVGQKVQIAFYVNLKTSNKSPFWKIHSVSIKDVVAAPASTTP